MCQTENSSRMVDTVVNPLLGALTALVLHHVSQQPRRKNPSAYIRSVDPWLIADVSRQEQFLNLLASLRHKLTTSYVIAELNGLERSKLDLSGAGTPNLPGEQHRRSYSVESGRGSRFAWSIWRVGPNFM